MKLLLFCWGASASAVGIMFGFLSLILGWPGVPLLVLLLAAGYLLGLFTSLIIYEKWYRCGN